MQCGMLFVLFVVNVLWLVNAYSVYVYVCCLSLCVCSAMSLCVVLLCVCCASLCLYVLCAVCICRHAVPGSLALPLAGSPWVL